MRLRKSVVLCIAALLGSGAAVCASETSVRNSDAGGIEKDVRPFQQLLDTAPLTFRWNLPVVVMYVFGGGDGEGDAEGPNCKSTSLKVDWGHRGVDTARCEITFDMCPDDEWRGTRYTALMTWVSHDSTWQFQRVRLAWRCWTDTSGWRATPCYR